MLSPETIRICRVNLDLSQGQLARMAGISASLLGQIERLDKPLHPDVARKIREAIEMTDEQIEELVSVTKKIKKGGKING